MKVEEGNKLIANFMGYTLKGNWVMIGDKYDGRYDISLLKFHSEWNYLMPVVEKIQALACNVNIINNYCQIIKFSDGDSPPLYQKTNTMAKSKIENTWQAVVQFINWLNTQTPQP